jgi:hypothetical protein
MPPLDDVVVRRLLEHPYVLHWFCQNLSIHVNYQRHDRRKVSPFPYGLKQTIHKHHSKDDEALQVYRDVFFQSLAESRKRQLLLSTQPQPIPLSPTIYVGPLYPWPERVAKKIPGVDLTAFRHYHHHHHHNNNNISNPSTFYLHPRDFYTQLSQHDFVLSPNGDRPECYRHYEALGLGVIPITELDQQYYGHLANGPIVFDTTDWNVQHIQSVLAQKGIPQRYRPLWGTMRHMVFEEYWMEYVEQVVGMTLSWWDSSRNVSTTMAQLQQRSWME